MTKVKKYDNIYNRIWGINMELVTVFFDDNKRIEVEKGTTYLEISKNSILKDTVLGVKKNNVILSLSDKVVEDSKIEFFDSNSIDGAKIYKAAIKFLFEVALKTIYPNADVFYLHSVPGGMLGEIKYNKILDIEDISKIKREMTNIIESNEPFIRYNILNKEAIDFYASSLSQEKAENIQIYDNFVTIYKLKDFLNYFYVSMPYSTKYIKLFELRYLNNNRIIITYPSNRSNGKLPEYVHHENIIKSFYEGQSWLKKLKTPYLADLNNLVRDSKIKGFIESCELHFN